jgi:hypothetical protein
MSDEQKPVPSDRGLLRLLVWGSALTHALLGGGLLLLAKGAKLLALLRGVA